MKSDNNVAKILGSPAWGSFRNLWGILIAVVVMCIFFSIMEPNFYTVTNFLTILRNSSINAMIAFGMTLVILMGGIDLSVPGTMASAGMVSTLVLRYQEQRTGPDPALFSDSQTFFMVTVSISAGLGVGILIGFFNGFFSSKFKIAPFIVTLAVSYITKGIALLSTRGTVVSVRVEAYNKMGTMMIGGIIPIQIVFMLGVFAILFICLNKTKYGRRVYAIGGNEQSARYSGIAVGRIKISSFMILGLLAAFGGIITCARMNSGQPTIGSNSELDAIAASILGGTSFTGGIGTLTGTMIGAIILYLIQNGLNLLSVDQFWQPVAKGIVILVAVYIDVQKYKQKQRA